MSNISPIRSDTNSQLIRELKDVLKRVETGEITAVAMVASNIDNHAEYVITGDWKFGFTALGAIHAMAAEMQNWIIQQSSLDPIPPPERTP